MDDSYAVTSMTIFTGAWAVANDAGVLQGFGVVFNRECGEPWGPVAVPGEMELLQVIEAMRPPYVTILSASGEDTHRLRALVELATADAPMVLH